MLLVYIWIVFFMIAFLLELIRTFVLHKAKTLYNFNTIQEIILALLGIYKVAFERTIDSNEILMHWLCLLKSIEIDKISDLNAPFFFKLQKISNNHSDMEVLHPIHPQIYFSK